MPEFRHMDFSRLIYQALVSRNLDSIAALLDGDIEWVIYGPIDMFPCFGERRGKEAAMAALRQIASKFTLHRIEQEYGVVGEDTIAMLARWTITPTNDTKRISVRVSKFAHFENGHITNLHVMIDALDLVEQVLGEEMRLPAMS